ncbi:hypothetical protein LTR97_005160 [Elasticomyces elasticus]|uniref:Protein kinase domain-containing protein n=1 Tax=Elasticomyces elasticus TaxID=574655 RepID=A0AAN7W7X1_9PEZI|nr:hypothetical protein LTR97_005160 [Elasticomyces elasticus]
MGDPVTALAAQQAVTIGAGLVKEGYKFGRRIQQAHGKVRAFESNITTANDILQAALSASSEVPRIQTQVDALRTALVAAQSKQEYELKHPKDGSIKKTAVACSDASIDRLARELGGAVQALDASAGLCNLDIAVQVHKLVEALPSTHGELLRKHEIQQRQWIEQHVGDRMHQLAMQQHASMQQMVYQMALNQREQHQHLFEVMQQSIARRDFTRIEQLHAFANQPNRVGRALPTREAVFTFIADVTKGVSGTVKAVESDLGIASKDIANQYIMHRADYLMDGADDFEIFISRWQPRDGLRRFEIRTRRHKILDFIPGFDCRPSHDYCFDYADFLRHLAELMAVLSPKIIPHSSLHGGLRLELGDVDCPLQVRCIKLQAIDMGYVAISRLDTLGLRCYDECEITHLYHVAGWVYRVVVAGETSVRKDIIDARHTSSFIAEVEALAALQHAPNVAKLHGLITTQNGQVVKGMLVELLDPLAQFIDSTSGLDLDGWYETFTTRHARTLAAAHEIIQIVADVHNMGFFIGEVVAGQFGLTDDDHIKLLGFKRRGCPATSRPPETYKNTSAGRANSEDETSDVFDEPSSRLGIKSDIWQMGALLLAMLLGTQRQRQQTRAGLVAALREQQYPEWMGALILSCLAPSPQKRPSACELLQFFRSQQTRTNNKAGLAKRRGSLVVPLMVEKRCRV